MQTHSQCQSCTRGAKEEVWTLPLQLDSLELIQQKYNYNSIIKWRLRCGCTATSYVCKGKSSNLKIHLQRQLVKYSKVEKQTTPGKGTNKTNAHFDNLSVQICCCKISQLMLFTMTVQEKTANNISTHAFRSIGPMKSIQRSQHLSYISLALFPSFMLPVST